jgi:phosphoglycolate phosphatase
MLAACIGPPLGETFGAHLPDPTPRRVEQAIALYRERFAAEGWCQNEVYPQVPGLLTALAERGWHASVATSKPTVFAERITRHFELRHHFTAIHGSELDGTRSAKPELLAHVLASQRAPAEQTVMVGDRRHDVEGARAVGVTSIGVTWGYGSREELSRAGADWICDTADQVLAALDSALGRG